MGIFQIGKDVSDDSITSSISDMEVAPLQNLIRDLKKEISSKDCVLQSKKIEISKYEDEICAKNKDLSECHRKLATLVKDNENYFQMIDNLRNTLGLHDETIKTLKLKNSELQMQYDDMNFTVSFLIQFLVFWCCPLGIHIFELDIFFTSVPNLVAIG